MLKWQETDNRAYSIGAVINISLKTSDYILIGYTPVFNREIRGKTVRSRNGRYRAKERKNVCMRGCICVFRWNEEGKRDKGKK